MVVPGVGRHPRRSFFSWEENGAVPAFILHVAKPGMTFDDLYAHADLYERLGVSEFWMFDPYEKVMRPPLQAARLRNGVYRYFGPGVTGGFRSDLGFRLTPSAGLLDLSPMPGGETQERIEWLEREIARSQQVVETTTREIEVLKAEVARLRGPHS
jgi:Uma2 family endonuclease